MTDWYRKPEDVTAHTVSEDSDLGNCNDRKFLQKMVKSYRNNYSPSYLLRSSESEKGKLVSAPAPKVGSEPLCRV